MLRRVMSRARRSAFFRADDYQAAHPDLSAVDPLGHYAEYGVWEGRAATTPEHFAMRSNRAVLLAQIGEPDADLFRRGYRRALTARPTVHLPQDAPDDDRRLAERIVAALDAIGVKASTKMGPPKDSDSDSIVVNPRRVFAPPHRSAPDHIAAAVVVTTAVPQDEAFASELPYMLAARGVIATEPATCAVLADAGVPTALLTGVHGFEATEPPPLSHPLFQGLTRDIRSASASTAWGERPIDVVALQPATSARTKAWSRMAFALAQRRAIVYQPPPGAVPDADEAAMRRYLYQRSKLVLHLHAAEPAPLDMRLIEQAAGAGAVIISEPSPLHPIVRQGVHYFEASARRMPALVDDLLATDAGRHAARAALQATRRAVARLQDLELAGLALASLFGPEETER